MSNFEQDKKLAEILENYCAKIEGYYYIIPSIQDKKYSVFHEKSEEESEYESCSSDDEEEIGNEEYIPSIFSSNQTEERTAAPVKPTVTHQSAINHQPQQPQDNGANNSRPQATQKPHGNTNFYFYSQNFLLGAAINLIMVGLLCAIDSNLILGGVCALAAIACVLIYGIIKLCEKVSKEREKDPKIKTMNAAEAAIKNVLHDVKAFFTSTKNMPSVSG